MTTEARSGPPTSRGRAKRPYTIHDQVRLRRLRDVAISPDGSRIVLRIETATRSGHALRSRLWLMASDGGALRPITRAGDDDSEPAFSPDGRTLYYIARSSSGGRQVVAQPVDGGEPTLVTRSPVDVESFRLSRDGRRIVFAASVVPIASDGTAATDTLALTARLGNEDRKRRATGRIHDKLFVRHWDEWKVGRRRHLFVQSVDGGSARDVMPRMDADSPARPFGGHEQFTFTPDGSAVVFTARDAGREEAWSTDLDLFIAPVDGSAPPAKLTSANRATDLDPAFSPDGRTLAYLAMARPGYEADKQTLIVRDWATGSERRLTDGWDRSAESIEWAPDGRTIYVTGHDTGQRPLFAVDVATGRVTRLTEQGHVTHVRAVGDLVYFALEDLEHPADLYVLEQGHTRRLTQLNDRRLAGIALGRAEQFSFAGWDGDTVHAYLITPPDLDPSKKYPIAFIIHGGPQGSSGNDWHYRWNPQVYAGAGYAVVEVDFHGSIGYGQAFTDAIRDDWGGKPLEDLKRGYAAALERYPFLDPSRAAALGASYGGFMINLIAGVWNEPWRCLVSHDGNLDERFAYFATEELWFPEWEHGGTPWENPESYAKHNPVNHIAEWRVPTLVIHGALDFRVSDAEGIAMFTALQRRGIPSRLLYFPDENHWVIKPANSVLWHETVLEWLDRWTAPEASPR